MSVRILTEFLGLIWFSCKFSFEFHNQLNINDMKSNLNKSYWLLSFNPLVNELFLSFNKMLYVHIISYYTKKILFNLNCLLTIMIENLLFLFFYIFVHDGLIKLCRPWNWRNVYMIILRERDYYSKNLSILNTSSFSDWNLFRDAKTFRTREIMTLFKW